MKEMEISRILAEQTLREHRGDIVEALITLTNWNCTEEIVPEDLVSYLWNSTVKYIESWERRLLLINIS